jgi:fatty-acyl-CoA synthase
MSKEYAPQSANYVQLTPLSFLHRSADVFPQRESVIYGDRRYTWQQTRSRCLKVASALINGGIKKGDTVAVFAFNTPELFEAHFAVPLCGGVLNTINTRLDEETVAYILDHGQACALIVDAELLPVATLGLKKLAKQIPVIIINDKQAGDMPTPDKALATTDYETFLESGDDNFAGMLPEDEWQSLSLNYTSGTTGRPKGVLYHHRGSYLMSMGTIAGWQMPMHPVYLYSVPMFHCNGWGHAWTLAALAGTCVCLRAVDAKLMFELMETHRVTHFGGAPIVLNMLASTNPADQKQFGREINVMTAGAPPPAAILQRMNKLGFKVIHVYGLTETFGHVLMAAPQAHWDELSAAEQAELHARQGVCFPMTDAVDVLAGDPPTSVPHDGATLGEIVMRGNTIMKGYLDNPEASAEAMHDGWFWSGDLAVVHADGYVQIKDRAKDIIISGGENISSVEIENALAEAAVVAMPDEKWGESPCAFVTLRDGASATEQEIIDHVASLIARFKRPKRVVFGELPKTATGKIQKYELRNQLRD